MIGTYDVDTNLLNDYLDTVCPEAWAENLGTVSQVYVHGVCELSDFELEELDDSIYNKLVRSQS